MNLVLRRFSYTKHGIFSQLYDEKGEPFCFTIERAYPSEDGGFEPKLSPGIYSCARGSHRLEHMDHDFETFEVMGVKDHSGILFHVGNWNKDSSGCILMGSGFSGDCMLTDSRLTFGRFMGLMKGSDEFGLTVVA